MGTARSSRFVRHLFRGLDETTRTSNVRLSGDQRSFIGDIEEGIPTRFDALRV